VLTGHAAAVNAGPAIGLSFVLSAIACAFAGLCYAEMASTVPISGSAYTYAYATMGEIVAWIIGWDLILEYALGATTVAIGRRAMPSVCSAISELWCPTAMRNRPSHTMLRIACGI
jgi:amino acid transporter